MTPAAIPQVYATAVGVGEQTDSVQDNDVKTETVVAAVAVVTVSVAVSLICRVEDIGEILVSLTPLIDVVAVAVSPASTVEVDGMVVSLRGIVEVMALSVSPTKIVEFIAVVVWLTGIVELTQCILLLFGSRTMWPVVVLKKTTSCNVVAEVIDRLC